jgi:hypothetical protein
MAKNQSNIWQVFLFFEWIGLIVAAVLFFAPINGYSLREYYFYSDIEKALGDFLLPGIEQKRLSSGLALSSPSAVVSLSILSSATTKMNNEI